MYSLLNTNALKAVLERELLPFVLSLVIAQIFFKWGSFALELVGFLVTWYVLGHIAERVLRTRNR